MIGWWKNRKIKHAIRHGHSKRVQVLCNLSEIKKAVILIAYNQYESVAPFIEKLQQRGIDTTLWLLKTPKKEYEQYANLPHTRIVRREELTRFTALPSHTLRKEWQELQFDALFNLTTPTISTGLHLVALSKATLKVGNTDEKYPIYDVTIATKERENATIWGDNILFYLSKIDMKNNNL